jgi:hypothetical protein
MLFHVIEISNPSIAVRSRVLAGHPRETELVTELAGCNLDEILAARDSDELAKRAKERVASGEQIDHKPLFMVPKRRKRRKKNGDPDETEDEEDSNEDIKKAEKN